jgi:hypothetical protein
MNEVEINKQAKLSEHFSLGELSKTKHVTADKNIPCVGKEQMIRYASILLDIADGTGKDYDELLLEQHGNICWLHFAVRPKENRRKILFLKA